MKFFLHRTVVALGLSLLFMGVYGFCNNFTVGREDVGMIRFAWEQWIPFLPWMTVPYLSIDLFFVTAPFLIREGDRLSRFSRRVVFVVLVAGVCYLIFPLTVAADRPSFGGPLGAVWDWFKGMDKPHNLMPSLHMALRTLLAAVYVRHTRGWIRWAAGLWFSLIGFSTLTTYQHHFIDVYTGILLGVVALQCCGPYPWAIGRSANVAVARRYGLGALVMGVAVVLSWPVGFFLLWPLVSFLGMAAAYAGFRPAVYRKEEGLVVFCSWMLYAPVLWGQWISWAYYSRLSRPWDEVVPGVWLGRQLLASEARRAVQSGVTAVLDMTIEFSEPDPFCQVSYLNIPVLDLTAPTVEQLDQAARYIEAHAGEGIVYVHCKAGYSRSAAALAAYLMRSGRSGSVEAACALIRQKRPGVVIRPEILAALDKFDVELQQPL